MDFLSHVLPSALVADRHKNVAGRLADAIAAALGACRETLQRGALLHVDRSDLEFINVSAVVVFGVGDGAFQRLLYY
jgi:hypothetical protein